MDTTSRIIAPIDLHVHLAGGTVRDVQRLQERTGPGEGWREASPDACGRAGLAPGVGARLGSLADGRAALRERERCAELGVQLVSWRHADYPSELLDLYRPPVLLAVRGAWPPPQPALAMVGARAATSYGRLAAERFAACAARAGVAVVSGLARGIDRWALEAAQDEKGAVVAVLGCGIDRSYPRENHRLQEAIARAGTLVSEFPLGYPPDRWTFPRRNRVIAALACAVLVVEAGVRSGALITASHALELGREVWAVPGPIDSPTAEGVNRLILDGAAPVLDEAGLLLLLGRADTDQGSSPPASADPVLDALALRSADGDELAAITGLAVARLRAHLMALELEGRVRRLPGDRWCLRRAPVGR